MNSERVPISLWMTSYDGQSTTVVERDSNFAIVTGPEPKRLFIDTNDDSDDSFLDGILLGLQLAEVSISERINIHCGKMWKIPDMVTAILSGLKQLLLMAVHMCNQKSVDPVPEKENKTFLCTLLSQKVEGLFGRGYYNGPPSYQHPYHGIGFDPLLLLAGLAFLALLLQTVHILFYSKHAFSVPHPSSSSRSEESVVQLAEVVGKALQKYGNENSAKNNNPIEESMVNKFFSTILQHG